MKKLQRMFYNGARTCNTCINTLKYNVLDTVDLLEKYKTGRYRKFRFPEKVIDEVPQGYQEYPSNSFLTEVINEDRSYEQPLPNFKL